MLAPWPIVVLVELGKGSITIACCPSVRQCRGRIDRSHSAERCGGRSIVGMGLERGGAHNLLNKIKTGDELKTLFIEQKCYSLYTTEGHSHRRYVNRVSGVFTRHKR